MENQMFCFQCEQTAGCTGCTGARGVCGKSATTANLQDQLTGALIGLARVCKKNPGTETTDRLILEGLFATITNVNFDDDSLIEIIDRVHEEKKLLSLGCKEGDSLCAGMEDYNMERIWEAQETVRSLKSLVLFGIRGIGAYAYHAAVLGYHSAEVRDFLYKALFLLGEDTDCLLYTSDAADD